MKRAAAILIVIAGLLAGGWLFPTTYAQDDPSDLATVVAELQTRVAVLETQTATGATAAATTAPTNSDADPALTPTPSGDASQSDGGPGTQQGASRFVGGNAGGLLPRGTAGELSVVATGVYDGSSLPLVVRNNTDQAVADVTVASTVRGSDGNLLATGGDQGFKPSTIGPGDIAIGYVYFDGAELSADASYEFEVDADTPGDRTLGRLDLEVAESSLVNDRVVGVLSNPHDEVVSGPIGVYLACFAEVGTLVSFHQGFTDKDEAAPGETVPFQVTMFGDASCPRFAVAASGYNF